MPILPTAPTARLCDAVVLRDMIARADGLRVALFGLGLSGGGEGAARFFAERGADVTVTDARARDELAPVIDRLADLDLTYSLGGNDPAVLAAADLVVANPAVPRTNPRLVACARAGIPMTSPMNVFLAACPAPVAAVTGSVGKSTTSAMLAAMLGRAGRTVHFGGNIGVSLLPVLSRIRPSDAVVLETSSFQLEDADCLPWSPHVAVVTNVVPNHLDRYGTFERYAAAKRPILAHQTALDAAVLNADDEVIAAWRAEGSLDADVVTFDARPEARLAGRGACVRNGSLVWTEPGRADVLLCRVDDIALPGTHNVQNALAAAAAATVLGVGPEAVAAAVRSFTALPHRLEPCGQCDGLAFFNDSDATTPESTIAALTSLERPITLIAGGSSKGLALGSLGRAIAAEACALVTIGVSGPDIAREAVRAAHETGAGLVLHEAGSLAEAVDVAVRTSAPGSAVVLSPACASFDMFANFADRGDQFKALVAELIARRTASAGQRV